MRAQAGGRDATRFYQILELDAGASQADIKKAYRRLAVVHHPDKGGDEEKFKDITRAYEVLSDENKRRLYDNHGEDGLQGGAADPADIFKMFFGIPGAQGGQPGVRRRTKDIVHPLSVSLEQLYTGCTRKMAVHREVVDHDASATACAACSGSGVRQEVVRLGLGGMQSACSQCSGSGQAGKMKKVREVLEVFVEKGTPHGYRIPFVGKADEHLDCEPGDVVFIVHQQDHPDFKRRGVDLFVHREISLLEALIGFRTLLTHLDHRQIIVKTEPGTVVQPMAEGTGLKALPDEGMPTHRSPFVFGTLFLILTIKFPDSVDPALYPKLRRALPGLEPGGEAADDEDVEVCQLEEIDPVESEKANEVYCRRPEPEASAHPGKGNGRGNVDGGGCGGGGGFGAGGDGPPPGCPQQ